MSAIRMQMSDCECSLNCQSGLREHRGKRAADYCRIACNANHPAARRVLGGAPCTPAPLSDTRSIRLASSGTPHGRDHAGDVVASACRAASRQQTDAATQAAPRPAPLSPRRRLLPFARSRAVPRQHRVRQATGELEAAAAPRRSAVARRPWRDKPSPVRSRDARAIPGHRSHPAARVRRGAEFAVRGERVRLGKVRSHSMRTAASRSSPSAASRGPSLVPLRCARLASGGDVLADEKGHARGRGLASEPHQGSRREP